MGLYRLFEEEGRDSMVIQPAGPRGLGREEGKIYL